MEALVVRLSGLDSYAEGAVRIVTYYDTLIRRRVDLAVLARASAGLAECTAGITVHGTQRTFRIAPDGTPATGPRPSTSGTVPITLDDEEIGIAWLERPGPPNPLDEMLLARLAIAAAAVVERYGPAHTTMSDPALVELAIGTDSDDASQARALRLLGFPADRPIYVAAVRTRLRLDRVAGRICPGRPAKAAVLVGTGVILATGIDPSRFPDGVQAGLGGPGRPDRSWSRARTALRFASARRPVVHHDDLGALALLAQLSPDVARDNPDVAAIGRLAADPDRLLTLETYLASGSVRRCAELLHLHHSSVARRLDRIGAALGVRLTDAHGRLRARLALTIWRTLDH